MVHTHASRTCRNFTRTPTLTNVLKCALSAANQDHLVNIQPQRPSFHGISQQLITPPEMGVQTKLTIGSANDKYEKEADAVAAQVVKAIYQPQLQPGESLSNTESDVLLRNSKPIHPKDDETLLQMKPTLRRVGMTGGPVSADFASEVQRARHGGQALPLHVQTQMERVMGADFSNVRVHTDTQADQLSRDVAARAFTIGQAVFFQQGEYQPDSRKGQQLLAHELTHVMQQSSCKVKSSARMCAKAAPESVAATVPGTQRKESIPEGGSRGARESSHLVQISTENTIENRIQRLFGKSVFMPSVDINKEQAVVTQTDQGHLLSHSALFLEYIASPKSVENSNAFRQKSRFKPSDQPSDEENINKEELQILHLKTVGGNLKIELKDMDLRDGNSGKEITKWGKHRSLIVTREKVEEILQIAAEMDAYCKDKRLTYASLKGSVTSSWRKATKDRTQSMTCKDVTDGILMNAGIVKRVPRLILNPARRFHPLTDQYKQRQV